MGGEALDVDGLLQRAGIAPDTAAAAIAIDAMLQHWRRRAMKRELGHRALKDLGIALDLAQLDVLFAIAASEHEFGALAGGETMVAAVAERLNIDPSRASRVVGDVVDGGYARRAVSQADARRSIVELTPAGETVVAAVRAYKFLIMGDFLGEWTAEDVAAFLPLLQRFGHWQDRTPESVEKFADEIATLRAAIVDEREDVPA